MFGLRASSSRVLRSIECRRAGTGDVDCMVVMDYTHVPDVAQTTEILPG